MEITLKPLRQDNLRFLLLVRNEESTRTQLGDDSSFTLDECEDWFEKMKPKWLMIYNENNEEVGYIRTNGDEIGCDIHLDFRRKGYARAAYTKYLEDKDYADLWVFEDNHAKKLYEQLGFVETGENGLRRGRKYLKMVYKK
jgi:ribosomal protein S18 acetylase RimI-like enzyme